jgi:hypothetical protein
VGCKSLKKVKWSEVKGSEVKIGGLVIFFVFVVVFVVVGCIVYVLGVVV